MNVQWTLTICALLILMPRAVVANAYGFRTILLATIISLTVFHGVIPPWVPWGLTLCIAIPRLVTGFQGVTRKVFLIEVTKALILVFFQLAFSRFVPFAQLWGISYVQVDCFILVLFIVLLSRHVRHAWLMWTISYVFLSCLEWTSFMPRSVVLLELFWVIEFALCGFQCVIALPIWWNEKRTRNIV